MDRKDDNKDIINNEETNEEQLSNLNEDLKVNLEETEDEDKIEAGQLEENIKEENSKTEDKNIKNKKKIYASVAGVLVLICGMYFGAKKYDNLVYPEISLYEKDLSGLSEKELNKEVDSLVNYINNNTIEVKVKDKKYEIKVSDIVEDIETDTVKKEIISYGKDRSFIEQFGLIYLNVNRNYNFNMKLNNEVLDNKIEEIYEDSCIQPVNATLDISGDDKVKIVESKKGKGIDKVALMNEIINAINSNEIGETKVVLEEEYKSIDSEISEEDIADIKDKISTSTTYFNVGTNRGLNIANAANKINGTLLMPGDEFSYEEKVSPVELSNGYYMAPVIVNGTHANAPGGGVCQVSSTLYNAELKAGILPTERYNHSKTVSYIKKGLDATLASGSKNLRFKNTYDYPVYIRAYTIGGQLTVEFWSNKSVLNGKTYNPVSFIQGNVANTYLYSYNSKGELVSKEFIDTSVYR